MTWATYRAITMPVARADWKAATTQTNRRARHALVAETAWLFCVDALHFRRLHSFRGGLSAAHQAERSRIVRFPDKGEDGNRYNQRHNPFNQELARIRRRRKHTVIH